MTVQYVVYFRFCGWSCFHVMEWMGQNQIRCMFRQIRQVAAPGAKSAVSFCFLGRLFWVDLIKWVSNVRPSICVYIGPSVHKVSSISMKFGMYIEVDEWCTTVCSMTRSKVKVKVMSPSQLEILPFSNVISSAINNGSWQLTTDSETRAHYLNLIWPDFYILVFMSRDFQLGRNVSCEESVGPIRG